MPTRAPAAARPRRRLLRLALALLLVPVAAVAAQGALASARAAVPDCASAGYTVAALGGPNFYIDSSDATMRSAYTGYRVTNQTGAPVTDLYVGLGQFTGGAVGLASGQAAAQRLGDLASSGAQSLFWYLTATGASASAQNHVVTVYRHDPALPTAVALCTATGGFSSVATTLSASANKVTGITVAGGAPKLGSTFTVTVTGNTGTIGQGIAGDANSFWMTPAVTAGWPADAFRLLATTITMSPDGSAADQTWNDRLRVAGLGSSSRDYTATYTFRAVGFTSSSATVQPVQQITSGTQVKHTGSYSVSLPAITPPVNDLTMSVANAPTRLDTGGGEATYTASVSGTAGAQLDGFDVTLPGDASVVPGSLTWAGQAIDDPVAVGGKQHVSGPFTVPNGGGALRLKVLHGPTVGSRSVVVQGVVGPSYVGTTASVLDGSNAASAATAVNRLPVSLSPSVVASGGGTASIPLTDLATDPDGDPLSITAVSAPSASVSVVGSSISYTGSPGPSGEQVSFTVGDGRGGSASGVATVLPFGSAPVTQPQTVSASAPASVIEGGTVQVTASATSGLTPVYASTTTGHCTVDPAGVVTGVSAGACSIEVSQPGDASWDPAPTQTVQLSVTAPPQPPVTPVTPTAQTVSATAPASVLVGGTVPVTASATSGLTPVYTSTTTGRCTVDSAGVVTGVSAGACAIEVSQPGDATYAAAPVETIHLDVDKAGQSIVVAPSVATTTPVGEDVTVPATATSGLAPVFASTTSSVCTVGAASGVVHPLTAGTCTITVDQGGDTATAPATQVPVSLQVTPLSQTVTGHLDASLLVGAVTTATATATSGLPVAWDSLTPSTCTVDAAGAVTALAPGSCRVRARQAGDSRYAAATPLELVSTVSAVPVPPPPPAPQAITLDVPSRVLAAPTSLAVTATATSGLPVAVAVVDGPCTLAADRLVAAAVGTCTLEATQEGDASYLPATTVRALVEVVQPVADTLTLPAGVRDPAAVDVLANDPAGLTVVAVGSPAHGRSALTGLSVAYLPDAGFRGTDRFTYTVQDATGRTAVAEVAVTVANAEPTIQDAALEQLAGTTRSVALDLADANEDDLEVTVVDAPAHVDAVVRGRRLVVTPGTDVSGNVRVRLRVRDGAGGSATAVVTDVVSPVPVPSASRFLTADGTRVTWAAAATDGARYEVLVDGSVRCRTATRSCALTRIVGPAIDLSVRVVGADATRSTTTATTTSGSHRVLMATVYFAPGEDQLTAAQRQSLERIADRITTLGFRSADLDGYTDSDGGLAYNIALSHRRTATVAQLLRGHQIGSDQSWHGMDDPAASNDNAKGKAANRRVEIYVGF